MVMQAKYIVGARLMSKSNMQDIFWNSIPDIRAQAAGSSSCGSYIAACWVNLGNKSVLLREGAYPILTGNVTWRRQEFGHNNKDSIPLRGISTASGERLAALAFRLRRTLAPSALALALRARFSSRLRRSYLGQLPRIESLTKTIFVHEKRKFLRVRAL